MSSMSPYYQPAVVYGDWWYEDYPPYYWDYAGADYTNGWWWGENRNSQRNLGLEPLRLGPPQHQYRCR